jgi:hypothetical protein
MNQIIKNSLVFFFCFALVFSAISGKNENSYVENDFEVINILLLSFPINLAEQSKKNHLFFNYNKFNIKNLIKVGLLLIIGFVAIIYISFLIFVNLASHFKINLKKKKHFIAKYVKRVYNISVVQGFVWCFLIL